MPDKLIVFVCTGNVCRSPMAEYLLRHRLGADSGWTVASAGTAAGGGMKASMAAVEALDEMGIDLQPHLSRPVDDALVAQADMVVVMTRDHYNQLRSGYPEAEGRIYLMKSFDPEAETDDVADPIGLTVEVYRGIRDEIEAAMPGLLKYMKTFRREE